MGGQAALEYIILLGLLFIMVSPLVFLYHESVARISSKSIAEVTAQRIETVAKDVFSRGYPTNEVIQIVIPDNVVSNRTYIGNESIQISYYGDSGVVDVIKELPFATQGFLPNKPGEFLIKISATPNGSVDFSLMQFYLYPAARLLEVYYPDNITNNFTIVNEAGADIILNISVDDVGSFIDLNTSTLSLDATLQNVIVPASSNLTIDFLFNGTVAGYHFGSIFVENINGSESLQLILNVKEPDLTPSFMFNPQPNGAYFFNPVNISIETDENAACRYSDNGTDTAYPLMPNTFSETGGTSHYSSVNISDGYYVFFTRCNDSFGNYNDESINITFTLDAASFVVILESPSNSTYTTNNLYFNASTNKPAEWCGYSLSGAPNISMNNNTDSHYYYYAQNISEENHILRIWCNHTTIGYNYSTQYFNLSLPVPQITIESPLNSTYIYNDTWANITVDGPNYYCQYSFDGDSNQSMSNDTETHFYATLNSLANGVHNVTFSCNNSFNKWGIQTRHFTVQTQGEAFFNASVETIVFGIPHNGSIINITLNDGVMRVINESNEGNISYTAFFEDFEDGVEWTQWSESGGGSWSIQINEVDIPGTTNNKVAEAKGCGFGNECVLTALNSIDLQDNTNATLFLWRWLDPFLDSGEYLAVDFYNGTWNQITSWLGDVDDDSMWHNHTFNLSSLTALQSNFKLRIRANPSANNEEAEIDNITISTGYNEHRLNVIYTIANISAGFTAYQLSIDASRNSENMQVYADGVGIGTISSSGGQTIMYDVTSLVEDGELNVTFVDASTYKDATKDYLSVDFIQIHATV